MTTVAPPSGLFDRTRRQRRCGFATKKDAYWHHGRLLHDAETNRTSLERMLCVAKLVMTLCTDILRPSDDFEDVPVHYLGSHVLTHRDIESRPSGIEERALIQEIASLDPEDRPRARNYPGALAASFAIAVRPRASISREGLLTTHALLKIALEGEGNVELVRHGEKYTFSLPKLVFHEPLSSDCQISLKGKIDIGCPSTGLTCTMSLSTGGEATGLVKRLAGAGYETRCTLQGQWNGRIYVKDASNERQGILFAATDVTPSIASTIDLSSIKGRRLHRLWTAIHDSLMYIDGAQAMTKAGERLYDALQHRLRGLMPDSIVATAAMPIGADSDGDSDEDDSPIERDRRPAPPAIKEAHRLGSSMHYHLECLLQAIDVEDVRTAKTAIPKTAAPSLLEYWRLHQNCPER